MGTLGCTFTTALCRRRVLPDEGGGVLPSGRDEGEGDKEAALPFAGDGGADCTHSKPKLVKDTHTSKWKCH